MYEIGGDDGLARKVACLSQNLHVCLKALNVKLKARSGGM